MTIQAGIDGGEELQIASNLGWSEFLAWVESLDTDQYGRVVQLVEHGLTQEAEAAARELEAAISAETPEPDVASVGKSLLTVLNSAQGDDVIYVSNGMGPDTGEDDAGLSE